MPYQPMNNAAEKTPVQPALEDIEAAQDIPGARILAYRKAAGISQRKLAEKCDPPMDFTAIGRIERNQGYTSSTLKRLAAALECDVSDFFLPPELMAWSRLPDDMKQEVSQMIKRYSKAAGI